LQPGGHRFEPGILQPSLAEAAEGSEGGLNREFGGKLAATAALRELAAESWQLEASGFFDN